MENDDIKGLLKRFNKFRVERDLTLQETPTLLKMFVSQVDLLDNCKVLKPHKRTLYKIKKLIVNWQWLLRKGRDIYKGRIARGPQSLNGEEILRMWLFFFPRRNELEPQRRDIGVTPTQDGVYDATSTFYDALSPLYVKVFLINDQWGNDFMAYCGTSVDGNYGISGAAEDDFVIASFEAVSQD
jgi:hypothetical protein